MKISLFHNLGEQQAARLKSIQAKEKCLNDVLRALPFIDSMEIQDALLKHNWDTQMAIDELRVKFKKRNIDSVESSKNGHQESNGNNHKKAKKLKKEMLDSDDGGDYSNERVFDSDESDDEYQEEMSIQRKEVYDFFNNANLGELTSIKTCSLRKAEVIIDSRPFRNWEELVAKFNTQKPLTTELLNCCQEYLDKRNSLQKLMKKCKQIVVKLEKAVSDGAGINTQPYILNEEMKLSDYQMVGLNWMAVLHQSETNGKLTARYFYSLNTDLIVFVY